MKKTPYFPTATTAAFPEPTPQMPQVDPPTGLMGGAPIGGGSGPGAGAYAPPQPPQMPMPAPPPTASAPAGAGMGGGSGAPPDINSLLSAPIDWSKYNPRERNEFSDPTSPQYLPTMDPRLKELDAAFFSSMSPENAERLRASGQSPYAIAYNAGGYGYTWIPGVGEAPVEIAPGLSMPNGPTPYDASNPSKNAMLIPQALVRNGGLEVPGVSTAFERMNNVNSWANPIQQGIRSGPVPGMDGRPPTSGPGATPTPGMGGGGGGMQPSFPGMGGPGMGGGYGPPPGMPRGQMPGMPGMGGMGGGGGMGRGGPSWNVGQTPFGYTQWNRNNNFAPSFSSPQNFSNMLGLLGMMGGLGGAGMGFPMALGGGMGGGMGNSFSGLPGMMGMGMPGMGFNSFGGVPWGGGGGGGFGGGGGNNSPYANYDNPRNPYTIYEPNFGGGGGMPFGGFGGGFNPFLGAQMPNTRPTAARDGVGGGVWGGPPPSLANLFGGGGY